MHNPSTHRSSNSGHGDECDVEAFTISFLCFSVVVAVASSGGGVVGAFLIVLRNRLFGALVVVVEGDALDEAFGLMKIGTIPSPVETILSPSASLWSCSELDCA
jgi:hypothetical protein